VLIEGVFSWGLENFQVITSDMSKRDGFLIVIKKQITELIKKLRDESNDTN
jgi:hypothetical protein